MLVVIALGGNALLRRDQSLIANPDGTLTGIEAVIDKDATSALLAEGLGADALLLLTDVDGIYRDFGTDAARRIERLAPDAVRALDLPAGSMAPKAEAAAHFAESGPSRMAGIGRLGDALAIIEGRAGTRVMAVESA